MIYKFFNLYLKNYINKLVLIFFIFSVNCSFNNKEIEGERINVFENEELNIVKKNNINILFPKLKTKKEWKSSFGNVNGIQDNNDFLEENKVLFKKKIEKSKIFVTPILYKNNILVMTKNGNIISSDKYGNKIWQTSITPLTEKSGFLTGGGISAYKSLIIVTTSFGEVLALSSKNGNILWRNNFDGSFNMGATVYKNKIYIISSKGLALCLNLMGDILWSFLGPFEQNNLLNEPSPVIFNENVLFPFNSGTIKLVNSNNGEEIWSYESKKFDFGNARSIIKGFSSSLITSNDKIFISSYSGETEALNKNGKLLWTNSLNTNDDLLLVNDYIFLIDSNNRLVNISAENGKIIWTKNILSKEKSLYFFGLKLINSKIAILNENGSLVFFNINKNIFEPFFHLKLEIATNFIIVSKTIYFGSKEGHLIAVR